MCERERVGRSEWVYEVRVNVCWQKERVMECVREGCVSGCVGIAITEEVFYVWR